MNKPNNILRYISPNTSFVVNLDDYSRFIEIAKLEEQERIVTNIKSRISDLRACSKNDNCQEFASLIESYIDEWTEGA